VRFCDRLLLQEPGGESEQVAFLSSQVREAPVIAGHLAQLDR
jgi:hypothetical protein